MFTIMHVGSRLERTNKKSKSISISIGKLNEFVDFQGIFSSPVKVTFSIWVTAKLWLFICFWFLSDDKFTFYSSELRFILSNFNVTLSSPDCSCNICFCHKGLLKYKYFHYVIVFLDSVLEVLIGSWFSIPLHHNQY